MRRFVAPAIMLLLSTIVVAESPNTSNVSGLRVWSQLDDDAKTAFSMGFLFGVMDAVEHARILSEHADDVLGVERSASAMFRFLVNYAFPDGSTPGSLKAAVDQFYDDPGNASVPLHIGVSRSFFTFQDW